MKNYIQEGEVIEVTVSSPAVPTAGVPCRFGSLCGVATLDEGAGGVSAATKTMVDFGGGVYDLAVTDTATGGIAIGDQIWFHDANPPLLNNVAASGYSFGVALEVITTGATDTINVLHIPRHGLGTTPADTTVTTAKLVADNVTAAKLTATLRTGFVPLDIFNARVIGTNEIAAVVGAATDPILSRENVATDKAGRLSWASGSVLEIQLPSVCYPPDLDDAAAIVVHVLAKMKSGSVDIPVIAVGAWEGVGGSNVGGNTAATSATLQDLTVTIAAGSVTAAPQPLAITLKPAAHNTGSNDVYVYGAYLAYTRK
jgi:predicted RecA/RadA family phage recombinase